MQNLHPAGARPVLAELGARRAVRVSSGSLRGIHQLGDQPEHAVEGAVLLHRAAERDAHAQHREVSRSAL